MRTEKQIEASRINGAKSRGPVSADGKRKSSQNAARHNLLAHSLALKLEDPSQFRWILDELTAEYQPGTFSEHLFVESMAIARWKELRFLVAEKVGVDLQTDTERENPREYPHMGVSIISEALRRMSNDERALAEWNRFHFRMEREFKSALIMLQRLQDRRGFKPSQSAAVASPQPAAPESEMQPAGDTPAPSGFVGMLPEPNDTKTNPAKTDLLQTKASSQVRFPENPTNPSAKGSAGDLVAGDFSATDSQITRTASTCHSDIRDGGTDFSLCPDLTLAA